jgi:transcriptional regulator with XRE-family HTH domain
MSEDVFLKEDLILLRKELGITQQDMATRLGMALRSYQAIEAGESEYRLVHRLAAERVALMFATDKKAPTLAPESVRIDAMELVRLGQLSGSPLFSRPPSEREPDAQINKECHNARFLAAFDVVGGLVHITTTLDCQLSHVMIQALHLTESPMLESVVATLDMARKIEMLRARAKHISNSTWRKPLLAYLDQVERVSKWRNIACHWPLIPDDDDGAVFVPTAAARLLKAMTIGEHPKTERYPISIFVTESDRGKATFSAGQNILENYKRANDERIKRYGSP